MATHATGLFPVLLENLSDNSDEVVLQGLVVLAEIVNSAHAKGTHCADVWTHKIDLQILCFRRQHQQNSLSEFYHKSFESVQRRETISGEPWVTDH